MDKNTKIIIGLVIIAVLLVIGIIWISTDVNTNMERVNITNSCSLELPKDIDFDKSEGNDTEKTFISLVSKSNSTSGRIFIDYEQSNNITSGENQTEASFNTEAGCYKCSVYDLQTHQRVEIRGDNPSVVGNIAKSVKFSNNTVVANNSTNNTVEHINNDTEQSNNNQQSGQGHNEESSTNSISNNNPDQIKTDSNGNPVYTQAENGYWYATTESGQLKGAGYDSPY